jgi:hypothetical protein
MASGAIALDDKQVGGLDHGSKQWAVMVVQQEGGQLPPGSVDAHQGRAGRVLMSSGM